MGDLSKLMANWSNEYVATLLGEMANATGPIINTAQVALLREAASRLQAPAVAEDGWHPIETAPNGTHLLYFPAIEGRNANSEMVRADRHPVSYPRKPSHWMPIPAAPGGSE